MYRESFLISDLASDPRNTLPRVNVPARCYSFPASAVSISIRFVSVLIHRISQNASRPWKIELNPLYRDDSRGSHIAGHLNTDSTYRHSGNAAETPPIRRLHLSSNGGKSCAKQPQDSSTLEPSAGHTSSFLRLT